MLQDRVPWILLPGNYSLNHSWGPYRSSFSPGKTFSRGNCRVHTWSCPWGSLACVPHSSKAKMFLNLSAASSSSLYSAPHTITASSSGHQRWQMLPQGSADCTPPPRCSSVRVWLLLLSLQGDAKSLSMVTKAGYLPCARH